MSGDDEMERARRKHAEAERLDWQRDQRETERQWRESEDRRRDTLREGGPANWKIVEVSENSWQVLLNGEAVALVIDTGTRKGTAIFELVERGEAIARFLPPGQVTPQSILEAFKRRELASGDR